jgi:hypothetical protein
MNISLTCISLMEIIYVIFFLNYFKTKYSIAHPLSYFENKYLYHPIGKSDIPVSNVCKFGQDASWLIALFILIRTLIISNNLVEINVISNLSSFTLITIIIFSLLNFNVLLYLIPFFITEYTLIKHNFFVKI